MLRELCCKLSNLNFKIFNGSLNLLLVYDGHLHKIELKYLPFLTFYLAEPAIVVVVDPYLKDLHKSF